MSDRILVYNLAQKQALLVSDSLFVHGSRQIDNDGSWFELHLQPGPNRSYKIFNPARALWIKGGDNPTRNGDPIVSAFPTVDHELPDELFLLAPDVQRNDQVVTLRIRRLDNFQLLFVSDDLDQGRNLAESHEDRFDERDIFLLLRNAFDEFLRGEPVMLFNIEQGEALVISNDKTIDERASIVEARSVDSDRIDTFVLRPAAEQPGAFRIHNPRSVLDLSVSRSRIGGDHPVKADHNPPPGSSREFRTRSAPSR